MFVEKMNLNQYKLKKINLEIKSLLSNFENEILYFLHFEFYFDKSEKIENLFNYQLNSFLIPLAKLNLAMRLDLFL